MTFLVLLLRKLRETVNHAGTWYLGVTRICIPGPRSRINISGSLVPSEARAVLAVGNRSAPAPALGGERAGPLSSVAGHFPNRCLSCSIENAALLTPETPPPRARLAARWRHRAASSCHCPEAAVAPG